MKRRHTQYKVVADFTIEALERQVNKMLDDGWLCAGGLTYCGAQFQYAQAMVEETYYK